MKAPTKVWTLMYKIYKEVIPEVHQILGSWKKRAEDIPDPELREHALGSIDKKAFHCEGGGVYALLTRKEKRTDLLQFIVAYQTISDYLDSLCDWSDSQDPEDFRLLHTSMKHALDPDAKNDTDYYKLHQAQDDGGYLKELVATCQTMLKTFPGFSHAQEEMEELSAYYRDLQVYKHVAKEDREPLLQDWFQKYNKRLPEMTWYEFGACAGSTLGIFTLAAYASRSHIANVQAQSIKQAYFPYVQGLHILMDYFIDQEEDIRDGELNFCAYYEDEETLVKRVRYFKEQAMKSVEKLPDATFHAMIIKGVVAIYLADDKVQTNPALKATANRFIRFSGLPTLFFYVNSWWVYRQKTKELEGDV
ncbi:tetraprenyl-beta-curcumene synthase [Alteribacillus persepolensis]|uniref:Tetraprenyl-beta-curcumene synthase n=1 Tax=Alteribacillus persepolensis TaxID=568899 RepID=A0A1G8E308_9BACI|nr:tetraprenyl-beta-curcumene synthase family protein [Alteribacillus persepolensis]SDH64235.1 tetraprenyl-beta-curcumene synthase [Alteribacillus persepolensis]